MQIDKLLTEWLAFAKDVQPSCAAGADQLDFLRASTEAELQKLNVSQNSGKPIVSGSCAYTEADMLQFANWYRNGLTNLEYLTSTVEEKLAVWRNLR